VQSNEPKNKRARVRADAEPQSSPARLALLRETAIAAGASWAKRLRDALLHEGRLATGGWPGTMSEARGFAASFLTTERRSIPPLTREELTWLARATYAQARQDWLAGQNE
jgi:hypothetical protein